MSQAPIAVVKQLTSRLENSTASERLDTLQELQTLARTEAKLIGEYALQRVLDFLREQGSADEYQEILDLIDRLIKTRDRSAAIANTGIILSSIGNVELLLGKFTQFHTSSSRFNKSVTSLCTDWFATIYTLDNIYQGTYLNKTRSVFFVPLTRKVHLTF